MGNMKYLLAFIILSSATSFGQDARKYIDSFLAGKGDYHGPTDHKPIPYYEIGRYLNEVSSNRIMVHDDSKKIKRIYSLSIQGKKIEKVVSEWDSSDHLTRRIYWSNSNKKVEYYYNHITGKNLAVSYSAQSPFDIDAHNIKAIDTATDGKLTLEMIVESDYTADEYLYKRQILYPAQNVNSTSNIKGDKAFYNKNGYIDSIIMYEGISPTPYHVNFFYNKKLRLDSVRKSVKIVVPFSSETATEDYYYDFVYDKKGKLLTETEIEISGQLYLNKGNERKSSMTKAIYEYDKKGRLVKYTCYEPDRKGQGIDTTISTYIRLSHNMAIVDIHISKGMENRKNILHFDEYGNIISEQTNNQIKRNEYDFY
jgi:hypothetical protein